MTRVVWTRYSAVGLVALVCLLGTPVSAVPLTVANYNFSATYLGAGVGYSSVTSYTGWTSVGFGAKYLTNGTDGGFTNPSSTPGSVTPPASSYQPGLSGPYYQLAAADQPGTLYQDLGVAFAPLTTYTVDISGGRRTGNNSNYRNNITVFGLVSSLTSISASGPASTLATAGFLQEGNMTPGTFLWASSVGSPYAGLFSFTTGASVPSGNVVVYVQNTTTNRMHLGGVTVNAVTTSAVPEIDPAGIGSVLALVSGALALIERRRLKTA
jgi:hypothetical protein